MLYHPVPRYMIPASRLVQPASTSFFLNPKVASKVTLDPLQLVRVQLARAECLAEAGFPAEAASALAAVLSGGSTPKTTAGYAGRR